MLQNWTTTIIDDTNWFVYEIIFIMLGSIWKPVSIGTLCAMIAWQERAQGDYITGNVKK